MRGGIVSKGAKSYKHMKKILFFTLYTASLLIPSVSFAERRVPEDVKIITEDGWQLNAKWMKPVRENNVFLLIHSQKKDLMEWKTWFPEIERYGYGYLAVDLRGHGLSTLTPDGSTTSYRSFSIEGFDNEYNKMIRDIDGALIWLSSNTVSENRVVLVGSWLGANLAIKAAAINSNIPMTVAIYPSLNINSVLTVNPLRAYGKRPILMLVGYKYERKYTEFQILNGTARSAAGKENVFSIVEADIKNASSLNKNAIRKVIEWTRNPSLPETVNYDLSLSTAPVSLSTETADGEEDVPDYEEND